MISNYQQAIVAASLATVMIAMIFIISSAFESVVGYNIAIASFAATVAIIAFSPSSVSARPKVIASSYMIAASIGAIMHALPWEGIGIKSSLGVGIIMALFIVLRIVHPPAVAYFFGFILEGYGLTEFILTVPALLGFFIVLAVVAFIIEKIATWTGVIKKEKKPSSLSFYERTEQTIDNIVPYALIVLFIVILVEFLYPAYLASYSIYLSIIDWGIIILFIVDLTFKFNRIRNIPLFMRRHYLDIIATIPFFIVFRFFEGAAGIMRLASRGAIEVPVHGSSFLRFMRPLARFPRFAKMLERLEGISDIDTNKHSTEKK